MNIFFAFTAAVDKYWPRRNRVPCTGCNEETYCSEQCREEAWNNYHGPLCPSINSKVHLLYDLCKKIREASNDDQSLWCGSFSPVMMARIWASIACHAKRLAKESGHTLPTQAQWALAKTPYRRYVHLLFNLRVLLFDYNIYDVCLGESSRRV